MGCLSPRHDSVKGSTRESNSPAAVTRTPGGCRRPTDPRRKWGNGGGCLAGAALLFPLPGFLSFRWRILWVSGLRRRWDDDRRIKGASRICQRSFFSIGISGLECWIPSRHYRKPLILRIRVSGSQSLQISISFQFHNTATMIRIVMHDIYLAILLSEAHLCLSCCSREPLFECSYLFQVSPSRASE